MCSPPMNSKWHSSARRAKPSVCSGIRWCFSNAPDNLFHPLPEHDTVEGTVGDHALRRSLYTWLELRPPLKRAPSIAVTAAALTALRAGSR